MMISNKKSYTMRMLQLALALSLLHFDPHNYLQQQLHNWDTQLELHDGDGWELEMLRAVPMMEYPYVNRKSMMPLIDDLVQFDSIIRDGHTPSPYNITAYLLNISHEGSNETAAMQDIQTPNTLATGQTANGALNVTSNMSTISPSLNATTTAGLSGENRTGSNNSNETYTENGIDSCGDMSFASSLSSSCLASLLEQDDDSSFYLEEQRSVWEQNLADLNDFNDLPIITTPYAYLMQLKDNEQTSVELGFHDLHLEDFLPSISSINVECESILTPPVSRSTPISTLTSVAPSSSSSAPSNRFEGATALNGSFPHPNNGAAIKVEQLHDNDVTKNCLMNRTNLKVHDSKSNPKVQNCAEGLHIKSEPHEINQVKVEPLDDVNYKDDIKESIVMMENNKNTFINQVDFTKEESELVEVLWKQDIDLGYSLNLPQSTFSSDVTETSTITNNDNNNNNSNNKGNRECDATDNVNGIDIDNLEKLKALEELKLNNHNEFLSNDLSNNDENQLVDWSGIPFTIDNETGEYIRLPLDEILNDVIQFAELAIENDQIACNVNENTPTNDNKENNKILTSSTLSKCDLATTAPTQKQLYNRNLKERHSEIEGGELNNNDTFVLAIHNIKSENNNNNNYKNNNNKINQAKRGEQSIAINKEEKIEEDGDNNLIPFDDVDNLSSPLFDLDDEAKAELAGLDMMLHSTTPFVASHHHAHPHTHAHSHGHPQPHPSHPPHPHVHHHHHPSSHHHAHHARTGSSGLTQHYGGVNSAFHRQPTTSAGFHHATHQSRMPLSRGVSMEQRLQDIASLFNPIPSMGVGVGVGVSVMGGVSEMSPYHYPTHHYSYQTPAGATSNGHVHGQYSAGIAAPPPPPPPPPHTHTPTHTHTHPHLQHTHAAAMHHANATTSLSDLCTTQPHYGHNLGSAVSSSMHLTNSTHDNDNVAGPMSGGHMGAYKMEHHDIMYYSNSSAADINHTTTDGFINSILNDEDLHLMDMNVNENFCRMVDVNNTTSNNSSVLGLSNHLTNTSGLAMSTDTHANLATIGVVVDGDGSSGGTGSNGGGGMNAELMVVGGSGTTDRLDASSDSAVSSMGSERLSSLSDGEWGEGSDSAQDYHPGKYGGGGDTGGSGGNGNAGIGIGVTVVGPYDYSYNNGGTMQNNNNNNNNHNNNNRQPTVAQKKHHMFGKRFINEQTSNANTMTNVPLSSMDRIQNQVAAQSIKYEYESYAPINAQNLHSNDIDIHAMAPIIAKDYNLYGNGSYSLDFSMRTPRTSHEIIQHNHTYTLPQEPNCLPRPQLRDKKQSITSNKLSVCATSSSSSGTSTARGKSHINDNNSISGEGDDDIYMTRDEKRARAMNIPIPVTDIINLPMDEFNERLSKYDLSENQLSLIRDIRRRGKNKVAAQNCRKRKLDQIISLEDEVKQVRQRKEELQQQRERLFAERKRVSTKFNTLHRHVFQYLRDAAGNPCSPSEYSLQQAPDGSIYLLPRDSMGNKNDSLNNGDVGVGVGDANTLLPLNINISAANHNNSSGGSSNGTGPMIVASSQESLQNQRSRSRGDRSQQGHKQQQQQQQQHQHTTLAFEHIQHQHEGRQQQHHHQQQHVSISSIAPTSAAATVTAAANGTSTQNDNIINGPHNAHQVLPHQPQKD